jgi:predicted  nucleic acid-binding Zn-ribbon protein
MEMNPHTDTNKVSNTPRTDACPHCGAGNFGAEYGCGTMADHNMFCSDPRSRLCRERDKSHKLEAEVEMLTGRTKKAEDLIKGLHDGWKKARKAHLETCKNAQREIDKLHAENVCLQELIQEFYEWSRRDYPTESEVREIMDRYYNLLNK